MMHPSKAASAPSQPVSLGTSSRVWNRSTELVLLQAYAEAMSD